MTLQPATGNKMPIKFGMLIITEDTTSGFKYWEDKKKECLPNGAIVDALLKNSADNNDETQASLMVEYSIQMIKQLNLDYANGEDIEPNFYRELYCVVDVDDNDIIKPKGSAKTHLQTAYDLMGAANRANPGIKHHLIVSNECFEIWYILHFQEADQPLYREVKRWEREIATDKSNLINQVLKNCTGVGTKRQKKCTNFFEILQEKGNEDDAINRAKTLDNSSQLSGNPSTDAYKLVERLNMFRTA